MEAKEPSLQQQQQQPQRMHFNICLFHRNILYLSNAQLVVKK